MAFGEAVVVNGLNMTKDRTKNKFYYLYAAAIIRCHSGRRMAVVWIEVRVFQLWLNVLIPHKIVNFRTKLSLADGGVILWVVVLCLSACKITWKHLLGCLFTCKCFWYPHRRRWLRSCGLLLLLLLLFSIFCSIYWFVCLNVPDFYTILNQYLFFSFRDLLFYRWHLFGCGVSKKGVVCVKTDYTWDTNSMGIYWQKGVLVERGWGNKLCGEWFTYGVER